MVKKSHSPEQVINKLREAEILLNQGANVGEACRKIGAIATSKPLDLLRRRPSVRCTSDKL